VTGRNLDQHYIDTIAALFRIPEGHIAVNEFGPQMYIPSPKLKPALEELKEYSEIEEPSKDQKKRAGDLMEIVASLIFSGINYPKLIKKSYRGSMAQIDLFVFSADTAWIVLCKYLKIDYESGILIEGKATKDKVDHEKFSRFCHILESQFKSTKLGIFFTLNGATGFPIKGRKRQNQIGQARLCQVMFHASSGRYVVVFDLKDILQLNSNGSFMRLLRWKIDDIQQQSGLPTPDVDEIVKEIDLPPHLIGID
jgi:hypothetical protein